jgi:hypothetical protein
MKTLHVFKQSLWIMAIIIPLIGCTKTIHFNTPEMTPKYPGVSKPFPYRAALLVPQETRSFAFTIPLRRWNIGEAVPVHMASALKSAFNEVVTIEGDKHSAGFERNVLCQLGPGTNMKFGLLVITDKTATIELNCQITDASQRILWQGGVTHSETFNAGMVGTMLTLNAAASIFIKKADIDLESSEDAYANVLAIGSNTAMIMTVDKLMEKMVNEGRSSICPDCSEATHWRISVAPEK